MRTILTKAAALIALSMMVFAAHALDVAGEYCKSNGCRAGDGRTSGGSCAGNYCVAGSGGTSGGGCMGDRCQSGNGGTGGGFCFGDYCVAGEGRTGGGWCYGKGCQAGKGGTVGGSCVGEGCKPGNRGKVKKGETVQSIGCCIAWMNAGVVNFTDPVTQCNRLLKRSTNPAKCAYTYQEHPGAPVQWKEAEPASSKAPDPLPGPPTSLAEILKQTGKK